MVLKEARTRRTNIGGSHLSEESDSYRVEVVPGAGMGEPGFSRDSIGFSRWSPGVDGGGQRQRRQQNSAKVLNACSLCA